MTRRSFIKDRGKRRGRVSSPPPAADDRIDDVHGSPSLIEQAFESADAEIEALDLDENRIQPSDTLIDVARKYAELRQKKAKHDEAGALIKQEMSHLEEWLLEEMAGDVQNLKVNVVVDGEPRTFTIYQIDDTNVWKGKGVETSALCRALEAVGWGDLVGETVNNRTLKATVREARKRSDDGLFADQARWFCPKCDSFFGDASLTTFVDDSNFTNENTRPACGGCSDPENGEFAQLVEMTEEGVPKQLVELLTIEDVKKLGVRRA